jgi:membrane dipeptidase
MNNTNSAKIPAVDGHVDLLYDLLRHHHQVAFSQLTDAWIRRETLRSGTIAFFASALYCSDDWNGAEHAATHLHTLLTYAERYLDTLPTIHDKEQLSGHFTGDTNPGVVLLLENADALLEVPLALLTQRGCRVVGLTHVGKNRIGDGNAVKQASGLTPAGLDLVHNLDRSGFAIDTAHLSEPSFRDVVNEFNGPIMNSHTGLRAFHNTPRNIRDEQMNVICERGGVIGIAACPELLSADGTADLAELFRQIDYCVQRFGPAAIGIGSDFGGYDSACQGFTHHGQFPKLIQLFSSAGYPDTAIRAIMGGNWFRFYHNLLPAKA